uniref:Acyl-CoA synthetase n=1 Tax=Panagrolaimus sp. JU765 TaxID=591449 RepID=A0AC34RGF1_9BILA
MESDKRNETVCLPVPLYHSFGSVGMLKVLNHRETAVLPSPTFNAEATLKAIAEEKCTLLYGTPTMFIDVLNRPELPKTDISSLHGGIIAGAPCPISLCQRMVKELNMKDFVVCYGSTEISPVVAMSHLSESPEERCKSVGHVLDHLEMAIFDKNNQIVERGEMGEIVARGYSVMQGYFNDDEKTREAITADRWYHTGDTGFMNPDGSVVISGRSKDMIIRGGENIYPTEIEQLLHKHPEIDDVHVIGVPDQRLGEEICAWIRLATHSKLTPEKVKEFCQGKISHNKIPKYILFKKESDFPLTATGKVMKHELKKLSQHELGLEQVKSHFN